MSQHNRETSRPAGVSRRTVAQGLGWSVPAVAAATAAPAFAASADACLSFDWATTPSTAPAPTTITAQTSTGETADVTITPASGGPYNWADGNYGQQTLATSNGAVFLGTWANTGTTYAQRDQYGARLAMTFPSNATGPISFTIGDLTAASGSSVDNVGANYYVDAVQVTNNGSVVSPLGTSGANLSGGWVQGTSTTPGFATYTIKEPGEVIVTLRNRTQETIASSAHPNQTISISRVVCGGEAPEPVTQPQSQSQCEPAITWTGGGGYDWGIANSSSTKQVLKQTAQVILTGLPSDAVITALRAEISFANRDEQQTDYWNANAAFDPGHRSANTRNSGNCTTNYAQITGCDFTGLFQRRTGNVYDFTPLNIPFYRSSTPGAAWEPDNGSTAKIALTRNWTDLEWSDGSTRRSWTVTYTGDPKIATSMMTTDAQGCKNFNSLDVPIMEFVYSNVVGPTAPASARIVEADVKFYVTATYGGRTQNFLALGLSNVPFRG